MCVLFSDEHLFLSEVPKEEKGKEGRDGRDGHWFFFACFLLCFDGDWPDSDLDLDWFGDTMGARRGR